MMRREESAYVAFGQYWLQARQQENTRLWMTNSISAVFAGLLAVIAWQGLAYWYVAAFGFSLALFGFFMNHTLRVLAVRYSRVASALMDSELGLGDYRRFVEGVDKKGVRGAWETLWSVHIAFVIFYAFAVGGWAGLLTMTQDTIDWLVIFAFVALTLSTLLFYRVFLWPREREAETQPIVSEKRQRDKRRQSPASGDGDET
jgi:type IV secretory pathway TrbD component